MGSLSNATENSWRHRFDNVYLLKEDVVLTKPVVTMLYMGCSALTPRSMDARPTPRGLESRLLTLTFSTLCLP